MVKLEVLLVTLLGCKPRKGIAVLLNNFRKDFPSIQGTESIDTLSIVLRVLKARTGKLAASNQYKNTFL